MKDASNNNRYHCIQCLHGTDSLYRKYSATSFKLSVCEKCGFDVDPYIEREDFLVAMDIVLLRRDAYRHFLLNRATEAFDVYGNPGRAIHYCVAVCILQTYLLWEDYLDDDGTGGSRQRTRQAVSSPETLASFWMEQGRDTVAIVSIFFLQTACRLLALGVASFWCFRWCSRSKTLPRRLVSRIFLAIVIPSFFTMVTIFVMIWENNSTIRFLGSLQILTYQVISLYTIGSVESLTLGEVCFAVAMALAISTFASVSISYFGAGIEDDSTILISRGVWRTLQDFS